MNWFGFRQGHVSESKDSWLHRTGSTAQENDHPPRSARSFQWPITIHCLQIIANWGFGPRWCRCCPCSFLESSPSWDSVAVSSHETSRSQMLFGWALAHAKTCELLSSSPCSVYSRVNWHAKKKQESPGSMIALVPVLFLSLARRSERSPSKMSNWT